MKSGLFPAKKHLQQGDVDAWREKVRGGIKDSVTGLEGLFVGIGAAFHAAKEAGIAGELLQQPVAIAALRRRLKDAMAQQGQNELKKEHRTIANLVLVIELISHVLHEKSWLIFRREWDLSGNPGVVANWTLGWYLMGEPRCEEWASRQMLEKPGRSVKM